MTFSLATTAVNGDRCGQIGRQIQGDVTEWDLLCKRRAQQDQRGQQHRINSHVNGLSSVVLRTMDLCLESPTCYPTPLNMRGGDVDKSLKLMRRSDHNLLRDRDRLQLRPGPRLGIGFEERHHDGSGINGRDVPLVVIVEPCTDPSVALSRDIIPNNRALSPSAVVLGVVGVTIPIFVDYRHRRRVTPVASSPGV